MANNSSNNRSAFLAARTRFNEASNLEPGASPPSPSGGGSMHWVLRSVSVTPAAVSKRRQI